MVHKFHKALGMALIVIYLLALLNLDRLFPVFKRATWLLAIPRLNTGIFMVLLMPLIPIAMFLFSRQIQMRNSPRSWIGEPLLTEGFYYLLGHIALIGAVIAWIQFI